MAPATLTGTALTYGADLAAEIVLPPIIDPVVEGAFDLYNLGFGDMPEKYSTYEKYAQPARSAAARYDKADGFLNGVNAFLGGDPEWNKGHWWNFQDGGSVELGDLVDEPTMQRLKEQGYTFQEL